MKSKRRGLLLALLVLACAAVWLYSRAGGPTAEGGSSLSLLDDAGTASAAPAPSDASEAAAPAAATAVPDEDGVYDSKEDVALYLHLYGRLPANYISKAEAQALGWPGGSLEPYAPGKCIGGSRFGNYEGRLPDAPGRSYYECDIDTLGAESRGAKRLVYSDDGLIYYTEDHYQTFELLYGGDA